MENIHKWSNICCDMFDRFLLIFDHLKCVCMSQKFCVKQYNSYAKSSPNYHEILLLKTCYFCLLYKYSISLSSFFFFFLAFFDKCIRTFIKLQTNP